MRYKVNLILLTVESSATLFVWYAKKKQREKTEESEYKKGTFLCHREKSSLWNRPGLIITRVFLISNSFRQEHCLHGKIFL